MAKKKGNLFGATVEYTKTNKGTSIGRKPIRDNVEREKIVDKENKQFEQVKAELEIVKKQRDIALGKLNKTLICITELRKIIEDAQKR
jgi:hypothetical protein